MLLALPTASGELLLLMLFEGFARAARSRGASLSLSLLHLRLQQVDGRRLDAFVADLHHSRVLRHAAPIVSYVSALPVRFRVFACVHCCAWAFRNVCGVLLCHCMDVAF